MRTNPSTLLMKTVVAVVSLVIAALAIALPNAAPAGPFDIRLVLLVAVDQFRYDYLTRFRSEYTQGFKRLLAEGAVFDRAAILPVGHGADARSGGTRPAAYS